MSLLDERAADDQNCTCLQCERLALRTAHMLYRQLGLGEKTHDYSDAHFRKTVEMVRALMRHMQNI